MVSVPLVNCLCHSAQELASLTAEMKFLSRMECVNSSRALARQKHDQCSLVQPLHSTWYRLAFAKGMAG